MPTSTRISLTILLLTAQATAFGQLSVVKEILGLGEGNHSYLRLEYRDKPHRSWFAASSLMDAQTEIWNPFFDQDSFPVSRLLNSRLFIGRQFHSPIVENGISVSGGILVGIQRQTIYARSTVGSSIAFTTKRSKNSSVMVGLPLAIRKRINDQWWIEVRGNLLAQMTTESIIRTTNRNPFQTPLSATFSINTGLTLNTSSTEKESIPASNGLRIGANLTDISFSGTGITFQFPIGEKVDLAVDGSFRFAQSEFMIRSFQSQAVESRTIAMHRVGTTLKRTVHEKEGIRSYLLGRFHFTHGKISLASGAVTPDPRFGFSSRFEILQTITENYGVSTGIGIEFSRNQRWLDAQLFSGYQIPNKFQGFLVMDPRLRQGSFIEFRLIFGANFKK